MRQSFFQQDFFRYVDLDPFNQYLRSKNLPQIDVPDKKADKDQAMSEYLVNLSDENGDIVVNDLMVVRDLSSDGGVVAIMELAEDATFKQALSELTSNINRVLHCLLHKPDLIEPALKLKQITATENFHVRRVECGRVLELFLTATPILIRLLFSEKSRFCQLTSTGK